MGRCVGKASTARPIGMASLTKVAIRAVGTGTVSPIRSGARAVGIGPKEKAQKEKVAAKETKIGRGKAKAR